MRFEQCLSKRRYLAPLVEMVRLGHTRSILETNSLGLTREDEDRIWEVDELEDYGEL